MGKADNSATSTVNAVSNEIGLPNNLPQGRHTSRHVSDEDDDDEFGAFFTFGTTDPEIATKSRDVKRLFKQERAISVFRWIIFVESLVLVGVELVVLAMAAWPFPPAYPIGYTIIQSLYATAPLFIVVPICHYILGLLVCLLGLVVSYSPNVRRFESALAIVVRVITVLP